MNKPSALTHQDTHGDLLCFELSDRLVDCQS
jgi:hypothetical protein